MSVLGINGNILVQENGKAITYGDDLLTAANAATGAEDTTLSSAVQTLINRSGKPTQTKTANPSTSAVTVTPDSGNLLSSVTVNPITSSLLAGLDADFVAGNIKKDVDLFGLVGTYNGNGSVAPRTCTVSFGFAPEYNDMGYYNQAILTRYINGSITYTNSQPGYGDTYDNVLCGSFIYLYVTGAYVFDIDVIGGTKFRIDFAGDNYEYGVAIPSDATTVTITATV